MLSKTFYSNQYWLDRNRVKFERYLRDSHDRKDRDYVRDLILNGYPDEGRRLIETYFYSNNDKFDMILDWIINEPNIILMGIGAPRTGKDGTICDLFERAIEKFKELDMPLPRFVTLGNIKKPPFVNKEDMYFSLLNIPSGTEEQEVWIYTSEIEAHFPARETRSFESRLYSTLSGTFAQNHQKLFGLCKLTYKVDINFIRDCNIKLFKYLSHETLNVEGIERDGILSGLGRWLLPDDPYDQTKSLFSFNKYLLTTTNDLPNWFTKDYSEMFRDISMEKIWEYVDTAYSNGLDLNTIRTALAFKFRNKKSTKEIAEHLGIDTTNLKVRV